MKILWAALILAAHPALRAMESPESLDISASLDQARQAGKSMALVPASLPEARGCGSPRLSDADRGDFKTPYACSFHWFRSQADRIIGLDLIRSDDTGKLALRAYLENEDGSLDGFVYEASRDRWAGFFTDRKPDLTSGKNVLGRGKDWIAGFAKDSSQGKEVAFDLNISPKSIGMGPGWAGLALFHLVARDYPKVQVKGWVRFNGKTFPIDSPGTTSIHYGSKLPQAAYITTVPSAINPRESGLLMASSAADNLKRGANLLGDRAIFYGYGQGKVFPILGNVARMQKKEVPVDPIKVVILSDVMPFRHQLLGEPTVTATAKAVFIVRWPWKKSEERIELGRVILDYRGPYYIQALP